MRLWDTNNSDAMYLAALVAGGSQMTRNQLDRWAKSAWWGMLSEYAVPFVAAEHPDGILLAKKWIQSTKENVAVSGWGTYTITISVWTDDKLDFTNLLDHLKIVETKIATAKNRVRYCMNGFVIVVGAYVKPLLREAKAMAKRIGTIEVLRIVR